MPREKSKWRPHEDESTEAAYRGGTARMSEEASVMEVEQRGCVIRFWQLVNQEWEEPMDKTKSFEIQEAHSPSPAGGILAGEGRKTGTTTFCSLEDGDCACDWIMGAG